MLLFLDRLLDVVCTYYFVARVTCLVPLKCKTLSVMREAEIQDLGYSIGGMNIRPHTHKVT